MRPVKVSPHVSSNRPAQHSQTLRQQGPLNFLVQTVNTLRLQFAEHEQVQPAEDCLRHFAKYQHRLERLRTNWFCPDGNSKAWVLLSWYPSCATRSGTSVWRLTWVSAVWVAIFAGIYSVLFWVAPPNAVPRSDEMAANQGALARQPTTPRGNDPALNVRAAPGVGVALWHSSITFLLQPSISVVEQDYELHKDLKASWWYKSAMLGELGIAYLHLGLLVSVLYRRITKRAP